MPIQTATHKVLHPSALSVSVWERQGLQNSGREPDPFFSDQNRGVLANMENVTRCSTQSVCIKLATENSSLQYFQCVP